MTEEKEKWNEALAILKNEIPSETYNTWVLTLVPEKVFNNSLRLLTPFAFTPMTLKMSYDKQITSALTTVYDEHTTFEVIYDEKLAEKYEKEAKKTEKQNPKKDTISSLNYNDKTTEMWSDYHLNTKYTFDNFVVGGYNKFAYGAALAVAQGSDKGRYNPLFIYGGSGLGKTHLMQSIGNYLLRKKNKKVKYVTSEEFLNDLMKNLSEGLEKEAFSKSSKMNKVMSKFRQKYRDTDILLIDDIQFVAGKKRTEEEVFNIFDTLHQAGKRIVLTSDRPPSEIKDLSERLKSRFEWGLTADLGMPDLETRMAILNKLIENDKSLDFKLDVIEFVASIFKNNIRELEGAYNKICAYCSIYEKQPTIDIVKEAINYNDRKKQITTDFIVGKSAEFYGLKKEDLVGISRVANIKNARQAAIYVAREITGDSWKSIGDVLGGKKHSTILYSYNEVAERMKTDSKLREEINTLFNIINQS